MINNCNLKFLLKEILQESPDSIKFVRSDGENIYMNWSGRNVHSIFSIYPLEGKHILFAVDRDKKNFYSSDKNFEKKINDFIDWAKSFAGGFPDIDLFYSSPKHKLFHWFLTTVFKETKLDKDFQYFSTDVTVYGRVYQYDNQIFCSFWNKSDMIKQHETLISDYFNSVKIPIDSVQFEPAEHWNTFISAKELFGGKKSSQISSVDDLSIQQKRELHLSPELKKKALRLPPHELTKIADKLHITLAQLKQQLGLADA